MHENYQLQACIDNMQAQHFAEVQALYATISTYQVLAYFLPLPLGLPWHMPRTSPDFCAQGQAHLLQGSYHMGAMITSRALESAQMHSMRADLEDAAAWSASCDASADRAVDLLARAVDRVDSLCRELRASQDRCKNLESDLKVRGPHWF